MNSEKLVSQMLDKGLSDEKMKQAFKALCKKFAEADQVDGLKDMYDLILLSNALARVSAIAKFNIVKFDKNEK